ncbi:E3 ubiquitin-protein ligase AIP2 [Phoenix dactylifera]|uniref:RING-type E3 ubiquitin transferase n=1 Tax=Phoenix dactylifera TaxID=42345 RepID=A0A8B7CEH2_PHODC|nr:E3 ubiquitin-protein ligase AIP2 [Phoenix dactylifera]
MASVELVMEELQALQKKLGKKQSFEEAVSSISSLLRDRYSSSSPSLRKSIYSTICRVATVLQTRYTATGFWLAGLRLFEEAEGLVTESSEKEHMKKCIARAREHLHEMESEIPVSNRGPTDSRYLFEGHLTVEPEPAPPAWLVAQNLLTTLAVAQDWTSIPESSRGQEENNDATENARVTDVPESVRELINNMQEIGGFLDLDNVIEASLQEIGAGAQRPPPASKEVVANLPVINVTEEVIARLGRETHCAVCQENFVKDDKLQELPCKHLFHPPCLKPWLDEHNSCPICRHEMRTDDHAYESWKEREREAEEERKGAANAVRGGEYMYV